MTKNIILATLFLSLSACTLSFKLKGFVYGHSIRQMESEYMSKAKEVLGEKPAASVYIAGLKKYNRIQNAREVKIEGNDAEFAVDKTMLKAEFAQIFLDFLVQESATNPSKKSEQVLNDFIKSHPEPWPTESFTVKLILKKSDKHWDVVSESRL